MSLLGKILYLFTKKRSGEIVYSEDRKKEFALNVVNKLEFGDIISAMVGSEPETKQEKFFIVIGVKNDKILCVECPRIDVDEITHMRCSDIFHTNAELKLRLAPFIIDGSNFCESRFRLSQDECAKLVKNVKFFGTAPDPSDGFTLLANFNIYNRDILKKDGVYYLVICADERNYKIVKLRGNSLSMIEPDFGEILTVSDLTDYLYSDTMSVSDYGRVMRNYHIGIKAVRNVESASVKLNYAQLADSVVYYKKRFYLIYDICGTKAKAFEVVINGEEANNGFKGDNDLNFIPYFDNEISFDINSDDYKRICGVAYSTMSGVRASRRKHFNERRAAARKPSYKFVINVGEAFECNRFFSKKFVVVDLTGEDIIAVDFDSFFDGRSDDFRYMIFRNNDRGLSKYNVINDGVRAMIDRNMPRLLEDCAKRRTRFFKKKII